MTARGRQGELLEMINPNGGKREITNGRLCLQDAADGGRKPVFLISEKPLRTAQEGAKGEKRK